MEDIAWILWNITEYRKLHDYIMYLWNLRKKQPAMVIRILSRDVNKDSKASEAIFLRFALF